MSVFGSSYADGYDSLYTEKDYRGECDLVERCLASGTTGRARSILDVGCGTGGHAIELARRGYVVAGVDLSPDMVKIAQKKCGELKADGVTPAFYVGDARSFKLPEGPLFDSAVMMFAVIGYLNTNDDVIAALTNIRKHLHPGATFVCDFWWGPAVLTQRPGERVRIAPTLTGKLLRATNTHLDTLTNVAQVNFELFALDADKPAKEFRETHKMRYFFGPELDVLFRLSGFRLHKLGQFPDVDADPNDYSWNATAVAFAM